jgi:hypothetical protein
MKKCTINAAQWGVLTVVRERGPCSADDAIGGDHRRRKTLETLVSRGLVRRVGASVALNSAADAYGITDAGAAVLDGPPPKVKAPRRERAVPTARGGPKRAASCDGYAELCLELTEACAEDGVRFVDVMAFLVRAALAVRAAERGERWTVDDFADAPGHRDAGAYGARVFEGLVFIGAGRVERLAGADGGSDD